MVRLHLAARRLTEIILVIVDEDPRGSHWSSAIYRRRIKKGEIENWAEVGNLSAIYAQKYMVSAPLGRPEISIQLL